MRKQNAIYAAIMVCSLLAVGCQKEYGVVPEGALRLSVEGFNGNKTAVAGTTVAWVEDDEVMINDAPYTVTISEGHAYTSTDVTEADNYYAYYPSDLHVSAQQTSPQSYAIYVPNTYSSSYNSGRQIIKLPMVACAGNGSTGLNFKHITSAILVNIKNSTGFPVYLDRVVVRSETQRLNSSRGGLVLTPDFQSNNVSVGAQTTNEPTEKYVVVTFGSEEVIISADGTKKVQIPILPISAVDNDLTIEVYTHSKLHTVITGLEGTLNTNYDFNYSKSAAAPALARNQMCEARIEITRQTANGHTTEVDHSLFSVAEGTKVRFSQGNLQFKTTGTHFVSSGGTVEGTWRFAEKQSDYIGADNASISDTYGGWIDLFGWGTSGWYSGGEGVNDVIAYQPWSTSTTSSHYQPAHNAGADLTDAYAKADWAWYNAISNGGNAVNKWRTMTYSEWEYLLLVSFNTSQSHGNGRPGADAKRSIGTVDGVGGVILLPDSWTLPSGCTFTPSTSSDGWTLNIYTSDQWEAMEAAGAVFLPAAGMRADRGISDVGDKGYYWTSSCHNDSHARCVSFGSNFNWGGAVTYINRSKGCSVRPVQDITSTTTR